MPGVERDFVLKKASEMKVEEERERWDRSRENKKGVALGHLAPHACRHFYLLASVFLTTFVSTATAILASFLLVEIQAEGRTRGL